MHAPLLVPLAYVCKWLSKHAFYQIDHLLLTFPLLVDSIADQLPLCHSLKAIMTCTQAQFKTALKGEGVGGGGVSKRCLFGHQRLLLKKMFFVTEHYNMDCFIVLSKASHCQ